MNATRRRKEVERLYFLSQQLLATDNVMELLNSIPQLRARRLWIDRPRPCTCPSARRSIAPALDHPELSEEQLESVSGRGELVVDEERQLCFVPLRIGVQAGGQSWAGRRGALARNAGSSGQPDRHFDRARWTRWKR